MIAEHDVVGAGNPHDVVAAGSAKKRKQIVHVVLIRLGVVGVANIDAHRQAHQLAAEMVLEPGADDLLAVVEIFRADKTHDRIDEQRRVAARHRIGACFHCLLIDAMMRLRRQRRALSGFEIHEIGARRRPVQRLDAGIGFVEQARGSRRTRGWPPRIPRSTEKPDRPDLPAP